MNSEFNFDGIVGPTHNYAGLSFGNIASQANNGIVANPKQAAKQGLQKMRLLRDLGIPQAVLPPQQRPNLDLLRNLGFTGDTAKILQATHKYSPQLLAASYSSASMWAANMATVSASSNTADQKVHITPANLSYNLHRAQEAEFNYRLLTRIFADPTQFKIHGPLPAYRDLNDEGAANHNVLCSEYGVPGLEMFVYGRLGLDDRAVVTNNYGTQHFPVRQTKLASSSIMRQHLLKPEHCLLVQQNPYAIDAGVFHNDVACVTNKNVLFYHSQAFAEWQPAKHAIEKFFANRCYFIEINAQQVSLATAVETYLFNSQLVSLPNSAAMALILPTECQANHAVSEVLKQIVADTNPIQQLHYVDCRQSMLNGGGPACLRLRVPLTEKQQQAIHRPLILDQKLDHKLELWINKHYRDHLSPEDLLDPQLTDEGYRALDELTRILGLGSIYNFQQF